MIVPKFWVYYCNDIGQRAANTGLSPIILWRPHKIHENITAYLKHSAIKMKFIASINWFQIQIQSFIFPTLKSIGFGLHVPIQFDCYTDDMIFMACGTVA